MPRTKSAKKAVRQTKKRTEINKKIKDAVRKSFKEVKKAIESGSSNLEGLIKTFQKSLGKAVKSGIVHKNTAARKLSRLISRVKKGDEKNAVGKELKKDSKKGPKKEKTS